MENSYNSLSVAVEDLQKKGYTEDFNLVEEGIESKSLKKEWKAGELDVVKFYRFEGMSNPADNSILYVIETQDGNKGLLVDNYSAKSDYLSPEMVKKLNITHEK
ncbi:phosphoribosylpyrophosphate synthetase [Marixanthomonas spongiae]|uniref:Phosphoribosylpyrophosphate synthetase n=1 Tax=Marixanthomonas spongiae TaxID=2174845 RepID=A0A2U0HWJ5_9FLAO|nr:phosphoribosylpyrophosphate synthetase [Marixanthomonas spongiae]PVW13110.1 phosphoribosylpyrophosphate synthetase [Marixanthomonas spongiae]